MSTVGVVPEGKSKKLHGRRVSEESHFSVRTISSSPYSESRIFPSTDRRGCRAQTTKMGFRPGHGTQGGNYIAQRVLSARVLRVKELQNELQETKNHMHELISENKMLKNLQKRQDTALARYEDSTSALPRLLENHRAEVSALKAHARAVRATARSLHRKLQRADGELNLLRDQHSKLKQIAGDRELDARSNLQKRVDELEDRLREMKDKNVTLNRKMELEIKSHTQQVNAEITKRKNLQKELTAALAEISRLSANAEGKHLSSRVGNGDSNDRDDLESTSCLLAGASCPSLNNQPLQNINLKHIPLKQVPARINTNLKRSIPQLNLTVSSMQKSKRNYELSTKKPVNRGAPPKEEVEQVTPKPPIPDVSPGEDRLLAKSILEGISAAEEELFLKSVLATKGSTDHAIPPETSRPDVASNDHLIESHTDSEKTTNSTGEKRGDKSASESKTIEGDVEKHSVNTPSDTEPEKQTSEKIMEWFGQGDDKEKQTNNKSDIFDWLQKETTAKTPPSVNISSTPSRRDSLTNTDSFSKSSDVGERPATNVSSFDSFESELNKITASEMATKLSTSANSTTGSEKSSLVTKSQNGTRSSSRRSSVPVKNSRWQRNADSGIGSSKLGSNIYDFDSELSNLDIISKSSADRDGSVKVSSALTTHRSRYTNDTKNNLIKTENHMSELDRQIKQYKNDRALRNPAVYGEAAESSDDEDFKECSIQDYIKNLGQSGDRKSDSNRLAAYGASTSKALEQVDIKSGNENEDSDASSDSHKSASVHYSSDEAFSSKFKELKYEDKTLQLNPHRAKNKSQSQDLLDPHAYLAQIDNSWKEIQERMEQDRISVNEKLSAYCRDVVADVEKSNTSIDKHQMDLEANVRETVILEKAVKVNTKINEQLKHGRIDSSKKNQLLAALKAIDTGNADSAAEKPEFLGSFSTSRGSKTKIMKELFED